MSYSDSQLREAAAMIFREYGLLSPSEWDRLNAPGKPVRQTLERRFGNWGEVQRMCAAEDLEIVAENVRLAKQKQRFQDSNRVERKSFREFARIENALEEYNRELVSLVRQYGLRTPTSLRHPVEPGLAGVVHLTDAHFNELVELPHNRYDFHVAAQRLRKFVIEAKRVFGAYGVTNVLLAMTGDMLNSDRRMDELLTNATNRSKATFLALHLLQQVVLDLSRDFNVSIASVSGNESRVSKEPHWSEIMATDNYDFTLYEGLKYLFEARKSVHFFDGDGGIEQVVCVAGRNILLLHGNQLAQKDIEKSIMRLVGQYADRGIIVDFVIFGHLHSCRIGDTYARGSSLVGANTYSDANLRLTSRASQNLHVITETSRHSVKVDLQDVTGVEGYHIHQQLEAYNAKSAAKGNRGVVIHQVVV